MKTCSKCKIEKNISEFVKSKNALNGVGCYCKICHNEKSRDYKEKNYEKCKIASSKAKKDGRRKRRIDVLNHYGNICKCCGEKTQEFLAIDHINSNGNKHRREIGVNSATDFCAWIQRNNYPDDLQILCYNCNMAKSIYGKCPHQEEYKKVKLI